MKYGICSVYSMETSKHFSVPRKKIPWYQDLSVSNITQYRAAVSPHCALPITTFTSSLYPPSTSLMPVSMSSSQASSQSDASSLNMLLLIALAELYMDATATAPPVPSAISDRLLPGILVRWIRRSTKSPLESTNITFLSPSKTERILILGADILTFFSQCGVSGE